MGLVTDSLVLDLIGISTALIVCFITYAKWTLGYWSRKGVYTKPPKFPFGNGEDTLKVKQSFGEMFKDLYLEYKQKGLKHGGAYFMLKPFYVPTDLDVVKRILQNDFASFVNHGAFVNEKDDPLSGHLFSLEDEKWRRIRIKLTPTFTSGKMKMMFNTLVNCSVGLDKMVEDYSISQEALDIKEILQRFTIDIISSCAFGVESSSMENPNSEFAVKGKAIFEPTFKNSFRNLLPFFISHDILRFFKHKLFDSDVTTFFMDMVNATVSYREKNNVYRKDFMHLLLQLKNRGNVFDDEELTGSEGKQALNMNELAAQAFVFFIAGYETSSTAMTFTLYELAQRPDIQVKLREEINRVLEKHDGKITYDSLNEMTYLDQILHEGLRKYPPVPFLFRKCNKPYNVPGTDVTIDKGVSVAISTLGIHRDPEHYPDPEKFDPDRFSEENKAKRHPFAWIPFGEGPRICIGLRFGVMQAKVGLTTILRNYNVSLSSKTSVPIKFNPKSVVLLTEGGVWIHTHKLNN